MRPVPASWGYDLVALGEGMVAFYRTMADDRQRVRGHQVIEAGRKWLQHNALPHLGPAMDTAREGVGTFDDSFEAECRMLAQVHATALAMTLSHALMGEFRLVTQSAEAFTQARIMTAALKSATRAVRTAFDADTAHAITSQSAGRACWMVADAIQHVAMPKYQITFGHLLNDVAHGAADMAETYGMPKGWTPHPGAMVQP